MKKVLCGKSPPEVAVTRLISLFPEDKSTFVTTPKGS